MAAVVVLDEAVREVEDRLRGAVVLLQPDGLHATVVLLEAQDVLHVGAAPSVDRLVVVAHHAKILVILRQQVDDLELSVVGVLILVDHDVSELAGVFLPHLFVPVEQKRGLQEQVVEVERVVFQEVVRVCLVDFVEHLRPLVLFLEFEEVLGADEVILVAADQAVYFAGRKGLAVDIQPLDDALDERLLIVGVVDHEIRFERQPVALVAQDTTANAVEGSHPQFARLKLEGGFETIPKLPRGLVGEGDDQNVVGIDAPLADQPGGTENHRAGLSTPCAGEDQNRSVNGLYDFLLARIQIAQQRTTQRGFHPGAESGPINPSSLLPASRYQ